MFKKFLIIFTLFLIASPVSGETRYIKVLDDYRILSSDFTEEEVNAITRNLLWVYDNFKFKLNPEVIIISKSDTSDYATARVLGISKIYNIQFAPKTLKLSDNDIRSIMLHEIYHLVLFNRGETSLTKCGRAYHETLANLVELTHVNRLLPSKELYENTYRWYKINRRLAIWQCSGPKLKTISETPPAHTFKEYPLDYKSKENSFE